jgi:hypothetical protein
MTVFHHSFDEELECLRGCSQYPQYYQGRENFKKNHCPFCTPDPKVNTILYSADGWIAWEVPQHFTTRQSTLDLQLVFFPRRHIRRNSELTTEERLGRYDVLDWAEETYPMHGGGIVNRFGDMRFNVGTIMHMHETVFVPNRKGEVLIPLQKSPEMWAEHDARMKEFARRYETGEIPE